MDNLPEDMHTSENSGFYYASQNKMGFAQSTDKAPFESDQNASGYRSNDYLHIIDQSNYFFLNFRDYVYVRNSSHYAANYAEIYFRDNSNWRFTKK